MKPKVKLNWKFW